MLILYIYLVGILPAWIFTAKHFRDDPSQAYPGECIYIGFITALVWPACLVVLFIWMLVQL